ncbi:hypothetical protein [Clostridium sp.]
MEFENKEVEELYLGLYKKHGYFHINFGYNHIITMDEAIYADELLSSLDD